MRIGDWSSDVCSSDLKRELPRQADVDGSRVEAARRPRDSRRPRRNAAPGAGGRGVHPLDLQFRGLLEHSRSDEGRLLRHRLYPIRERNGGVQGTIVYVGVVLGGIPLVKYNIFNIPSLKPSLT